jgi:hypothetical protein
LALDIPRKFKLYILTSVLVAQYSALIDKMLAYTSTRRSTHPSRTLRVLG